MYGNLRIKLKDLLIQCVQDCFNDDLLHQIITMYLQIRIAMIVHLRYFV